MPTRSAKTRPLDATAANHAESPIELASPRFARTQKLQTHGGIISVIGAEISRPRGTGHNKARAGVPDQLEPSYRRPNRLQFLNLSLRNSITPKTRWKVIQMVVVKRSAFFS